MQVRGDGVPGGHGNGNAAAPLPRMGDCPGRDSPPGRHVVDVRHESWKGPLVGGSDGATTLPVAGGSSIGGAAVLRLRVPGGGQRQAL